MTLPVEYSFSKAAVQDIPAVVSIIRLRQQWLTQRNLDQWNGYDEIFPPAYFTQKQSLGQLYVAKDDQGKICGTIALLPTDPYWEGRAHPYALYAHHLATLPEASGLGATLLDFCAAQARNGGYTLLRLDCAAANTRLNAYYHSQGFLPIGECVDGTYRGILREKVL